MEKEKKKTTKKSNIKADVKKSMKNRKTLTFSDKENIKFEQRIQSLENYISMLLSEHSVLLNVIQMTTNTNAAIIKLLLKKKVFTEKQFAKEFDIILKRVEEERKKVMEKNILDSEKVTDDEYLQMLENIDEQMMGNS